MTSTLDIAWAAGFIEGDGCFSSINRNPAITAIQVQREPLERLHRIFGGRLGTYQRKIVKGNLYHRWQISGYKAAAIQMTLYVLMSPWRQEQIQRALAKWKLPAMNHNASKNRCSQGHEFSESNTYRYPDGRRGCRACQDKNRRAYVARKARERLNAVNLTQ